MNQLWNLYEFYQWQFGISPLIIDQLLSFQTSNHLPIIKIQNNQENKQNEKFNHLIKVQQFHSNNEPDIKQSLEKINVKVENISQQDRNKKNDGLTKNDFISLKNSYRKVKWTEQDDQRLIQLVEKRNLCWHQVSIQFQDVTQKMCSTRYKRLKRNSPKYWKREEDKIILQMIQKIGQKWKEISKYLPNRSPKQVREHYINLLRPQIKTSPWSAEQDMRLFELVNQHGNKWRAFQNYLPGRTENHIKNRYYGRIKKIEQIKNKQFLK